MLEGVLCETMCSAAWSLPPYIPRCSCTHSYEAIGIAICTGLLLPISVLVVASASYY